MKLHLQDLFDGFRHPPTLDLLAGRIQQRAEQLTQPLRIMEVCGGHTHTLMKYGLTQRLPEQIEFIHGPGCPVCVMPKERIDQAIQLAHQPDVMLVTLGDLLRVPGSLGTLAQARAKGAHVHTVSSPLETLALAKDNPDRKWVFFAIGFETTTPMTAVLLEQARQRQLSNVFIHCNHVLVPPAVAALLSETPCWIDALIAPSHVSVITGADYYQALVDRFNKPVVVGGFEPVDLMQSVAMLVEQAIALQQGKPAQLQIQYTRSVKPSGNRKAQECVAKYFCLRERFRWRGLGEIVHSALQLKPQWQDWDAEHHWASLLSNSPQQDHRLCRCGEILRGSVKPLDCALFGRGCDPQHPLGSCMVSDEGACHAYFRFQAI
jgi:hydrogenase expression/formation protein HypD